MVTLYDLLGVDEDATAEAISVAYRRQARQYHPHVSERDDAGERFRRLTTARDVLTDERRRRRYDALGHRRFVERHLDPSNWPEVRSGSRSTAMPDPTTRRRRARPGAQTNGTGRRTGETGPSGRARPRSRAPICAAISTTFTATRSRNGSKR